MTHIDAPFQFANPWAFEQRGLPLRCSLPFPEGAINDPTDELAFTNESGEDLAAQWTTLSRWKDGSVRFALMDYAADVVPPRTTLKYRLTRKQGSKAASPTTGITISETDGRLTVDTGRLSWSFSKLHFAFAESITSHGQHWAPTRVGDMAVMDAAGQIYRASRGQYKLTIEQQGRHRVVLLMEGDYQNPTGRFLNYKVRWHFVAGSSQVLMLHTLRNREPGRTGQAVRRAWLEGQLDLGPKTIRRVLHTMRTVNTLQAPVDIPENVDLDTRHDSTLIRNIASLRQDPNDICESVKHASDMAMQNSCDALLDLHEPGVGGMLMKFAYPDAAREAPLRLASEDCRFEIDFFPEIEHQPPYATNPQSPAIEPVVLGEGMGKTRPVLFHFHDDSLPARDLFHISNAISHLGVVPVPRDMYREAKFADVHLTLKPQRNKYPVLESKIDTLLAAQWAYDWPVATGWKNWGDEIGARGRCPEFGVKQFINNEEDYLYCRMLDAWRLGQPVGGALQAQHLMDIDFIDYSPDPARDGAVCPHSTEHTNGEVYPSHQWCQGLLYYYLATGDMEALRIAKRIGDNLIWWITGPRSDSMTYSGRESAWPLLGLAALYDVTGDERYRDAGMVVINHFQNTFDEHGTLAWEYPPGSGIYSNYMYAMVFNGVWDMYAATGDQKILSLWKQITTPVIDQLSDPEHWGYVHFRNWPIKWADLTVLTRWYELTGDRKYVELGRNGLRLILAGCPQPLNQTQGFIAMGYRHFILYLKLADELGLLNDNDVTLVW